MDGNAMNLNLLYKVYLDDKTSVDLTYTLKKNTSQPHNFENSSDNFIFI